MKKMWKGNKKYSFLLMAGSMVFIIGIIIGNYIFSRLLAHAQLEPKNERIYQYHVAMINTKSNDIFWDSVYSGALSKGNEYDIYVENFGAGLSEEYSTTELLEMAIAAKVDGIILEAKYDEEMLDLFAKATEEGIPVITLLNDAPESQRKSFVSANDYALGEIYGSQVLDVAKDISKDEIKVTMLIGTEQNTSAPNLIYSGISEAIKYTDKTIGLNTVLVDSIGEFETEEKIRDLLLDKEQRPDVIVCSSVSDTTSAYQCVIDYNLVGEVQIIGYYTSSEILEGIDKEIIHSTVVINAQEMGSLSVEGMYEYLTEEYVNEYLSVSSHLITKDNVAAYYEELSEEDE